MIHRKQELLTVNFLIFQNINKYGLKIYSPLKCILNLSCQSLYLKFNIQNPLLDENKNVPTSTIDRGLTQLDLRSLDTFVKLPSVLSCILYISQRMVLRLFLLLYFIISPVSHLPLINMPNLLLMLLLSFLSDATMFHYSDCGLCFVELYTNVDGTQLQQCQPPFKWSE